MKPSISLNVVTLLAAIAAVGGSGMLGFTQGHEVRGDSALHESVLHANDAPETLAPAHEEMVDWRAYMLRLEAEDFATHTDPAHGFSFEYPRGFELTSTRWESEWGEEDVTDLYHPLYPVGLRVSVFPRTTWYEDVLFVMLPEEYTSGTWEAPRGAESEAIAWIEAMAPEHEYRGFIRFIGANGLYHITLTAPDAEWLEAWMREFLYYRLDLPFLPAETPQSAA